MPPRNLNFCFDERCLDLARYFYPHESDDNLRPLAQQLQDAVEDFGEAPKHASVEMPSTDSYRFDRYRNGQLMAEGIEITRQCTLEDALRAARRMCPPTDELRLAAINGVALTEMRDGIETGGSHV